MPKIIVSVSKKHNSVWRMYYYDFNEEGKPFFATKRINPLLIWYYKLKKSSLYTNVCSWCDNDFKFYAKKFEMKPDICSNCDPEIYDS
jgi:hypothetical protein